MNRTWIPALGEAEQVRCVRKEDKVTLRVLANGKLLHDVRTCGELLEAQGIKWDEAADVASKAFKDAEKKGFMKLRVKVNKGENNPAGALLKYKVGTYMLSQEPRCWPGDVFPVPVPACEFEMAPIDPKTG